MEDGMDDQYPGHTFVRDLGSGHFGTAKLYKDDRTGELSAVKFLKRGDQLAQAEQYVLREVFNHQQISGHPGVVQFKKVFLTKTHLGIAMEFAAGGELFSRIEKTGRFPEDVARYFFQQLISGVAWCHRQGVCHRDLKLENSLLDKEVPLSALMALDRILAARPRIKLCDFGYSKSSEFDSTPNTLVGTPAYVAPEVIAARAHSEYDGKLADVWSCGVTLYVMLVGAYPFEDPSDPSNFNRTMELITSVRYRIPSRIRLTPECTDLLARIFVADPAQRITLQQIKQHPWFRRNLPQEEEATVAETARQFSQSDLEIADIIHAATQLDPSTANKAADIALEEYMDLLQEGGSGTTDQMRDSYGYGRSDSGLMGGQSADLEMLLAQHNRSNQP